MTVNEDDEWETFFYLSSPDLAEIEENCILSNAKLEIAVPYENCGFQKIRVNNSLNYQVQIYYGNYFLGLFCI